MLNQISPISSEANSSGIFLKNYIDYVEDFPDDIMRLISICRELDVKKNNIIKESESISEKIITATKEKKAKLFSRLQQILIKLQDLNDEKIHFGQILAEKIETKFRTVDRDYQNNLNSKQDRIQSPIPSSSTARKTSIEQQLLSALPLKRTSATGSNISSSSSSENAGNDRNAKRIRRTRTDVSDDVPIKLENINKSSGIMSQSSNVNVKKANAAANKKQKKTAKKAVVNKQTTQAIQEPIQGIHDDVDPDEETYCLCGQISYGEMILCENDLCGIEWFHFSCVSLQSKPKGKWYCPNCRGDRPNVMNKNLKKKFQDSPNNDRKFV